MPLVSPLLFTDLPTPWAMPSLSHLPSFHHIPLPGDPRWLLGLGLASLYLHKIWTPPFLLCPIRGSLSDVMLLAKVSYCIGIKNLP